MRQSSQRPSIGIVIPVLDDEQFLARAVASVLEQDVDGRVEVCLAVGPSKDDTAIVAAELARDPRIFVIENPSGGTAAGLNLAIAATSAPVVARVDAHAELAAGYLRTAVRLLEQTGADNVGGVQHAVAVPGARTQAAIAAAMTSPFGVGDARFHYGGEAGPTDTVYLGVFRRSALERVGGFDESLVRNQDYELNWRIRDSGGVVWFDPSLRVTYRPRATLRALARQYRQYGQWKRVMLRRHPRSLRWRQLVPPATFLANASGIAAAFGTRSAVPLVVPAVYGLATVVASVLVPDVSPSVRIRLPAVFATMHHAWAWGLLRGGAETTSPTPSGASGQTLEGRDEV